MVILSASTVPAFAQEEGVRGTGRLSAETSGTPVPHGVAIEVTPGESDGIYGNDPLYGAVRKAVEGSLRARGYRVGPAPALRLRMIVSAVGYGQAQSPVGHTGPQSLTSPRPRPTVTDQFRVPFAEPESGTVPSLTVSLVLHDVSGGTVLWTSTVRVTGRFPDPEHTLAQLARVAMRVFGSASERSFEIGCSGTAPDRLCVQ